jgi:thioesterase domain-containing protein
LPATFEAAIAAQADAIAAYAGQRPFVLAGYSTGGALAHALAGRLAERGLAPAAVALIDTYSIAAMSRILAPVFDRMLADSDDVRPAVRDRGLTAMGAYLRLLDEWQPLDPVAPTLLVRAADPMPGIEGAQDWQASFGPRSATVEVPGDHLTLIEDGAPSTARAIEQWLDSVIAQRLDSSRS